MNKTDYGLAGSRHKQENYFEMPKVMKESLHSSDKKLHLNARSKIHLWTYVVDLDSFFSWLELRIICLFCFYLFSNKVTQSDYIEICWDNSDFVSSGKFFQMLVKIQHFFRICCNNCLEFSGPSVWAEERGQSLEQCGHGQVAILYCWLHCWGLWFQGKEKGACMHTGSATVCSLSPSGQLPALVVLQTLGITAAHSVPLPLSSVPSCSSETRLWKWPTQMRHSSFSFVYSWL